MADYNDYLKYLKHVDDTTAQDFKAKEDTLKKNISDLQAKHKDEKSKMENAYKKDISDLKTQFKDEKSKNEKAHKDEKIKSEDTLKKDISDLQAKHNDEKIRMKKDIKTKTNELLEKSNIINELQSKLENINDEIQCLRGCNAQNQEYRRQLMYIRFIGLFIGLILSILCFGIPIVIYLIYIIYKILNKEKYVSILHWVRCDIYTSIYK